MIWIVFFFSKFWWKRMNFRVTQNLGSSCTNCHVISASHLTSVEFSYLCSVKITSIPNKIVTTNWQNNVYKGQDIRYIRDIFVTLNRFLTFDTKAWFRNGNILRLNNETNNPIGKMERSEFEISPKKLHKWTIGKLKRCSTSAGY